MALFYAVSFCHPVTENELQFERKGLYFGSWLPNTAAFLFTPQLLLMFHSAIARGWASNHPHMRQKYNSISQLAWVVEAKMQAVFSPGGEKSITSY